MSLSTLTKTENLMYKLSLSLRNVLCCQSRHDMEQRIHQTLLQYISNLKETYSEIAKCKKKCQILAKHLLRSLDLINSIQISFSETYEYMYRISEIICYYVCCEVSLAQNKDEKCKIVNRIATVIKRYVEIPYAENVSKSNLLRLFILIAEKCKDADIVAPLYRSFIPQPIVVRQKELSDKIFIQYIIIFYLWMQCEYTPERKETVVAFAEKFMRPSKTLALNALYAYHLPKYTTRLTATRYILENLKFFKDLQNASIYDNSVKNIRGIIDFSGDDPILRATKTIPLPMLNGKKVDCLYEANKRNAIKLEYPTVVETIDLTENGSLRKHADLSFIHNFINKKVKDVEHMRKFLAEDSSPSDNPTIIILDSDNESEEGAAMPPKSFANQKKTNSVELFSLDFDRVNLNDFHSNYAEGNWSHPAKTSEDIENHIVEEDPIDPTKLVCKFNENEVYRTYANRSKKKTTLHATSDRIFYGQNQLDNDENRLTEQSFNDADAISNSSDVLLSGPVGVSCRRNSIHIKSSPSNCSSDNHSDYNGSVSSFVNQEPSQVLMPNELLPENNDNAKLTFAQKNGNEPLTTPVPSVERSNQNHQKQVQFNDIPIGPSSSKDKNTKKFPMKSALVSKNISCTAISLASSFTNYLVQRRRSVLNTDQRNESATTYNPMSDILKANLRREQLNAIPKIFSNFAPFKTAKSGALANQKKKKTTFQLGSCNAKLNMEKKSLIRSPKSSKSIDDSRLQSSINPMEKPNRKITKSSCNIGNVKQMKVSTNKGEGKNKSKSKTETESKSKNVKPSSILAKNKQESFCNDMDDPKLSNMKCAVVIKNDSNDAKFIESLLKRTTQRKKKSEKPKSSPNRNQKKAKMENRHNNLVIENVTNDPILIKNIENNMAGANSRNVAQALVHDIALIPPTQCDTNVSLNSFIESKEHEPKVEKTNTSSTSVPSPLASPFALPSVPSPRASPFALPSDKKKFIIRPLKIRVKRERLLNSAVHNKANHIDLPESSNYEPNSISSAHSVKSNPENKIFFAEEQVNTGGTKSDLEQIDKIVEGAFLIIENQDKSEFDASSSSSPISPTNTIEMFPNSSLIGKTLNEEEQSSRLISSLMCTSAQNCDDIIMPVIMEDTPPCTINHYEESRTVGNTAKENDLITECLTFRSENSSVGAREESSEGKLLEQIESNKVEVTKDIFFMNSINERDKVLLEIETTPTVPAYLFNGESRDVPTPTPTTQTSSCSNIQPASPLSNGEIIGDTSFCAPSPTAGTLLVSSSDHEVTSTQEILDHDTALMQTIKEISPATISLSYVPCLKKSLMVQNNHVDTTNSFNELSKANVDMTYSIGETKMSPDLAIHPQNNFNKLNTSNSNSLCCALLISPETKDISTDKNMDCSSLQDP